MKNTHRAWLMAMAIQSIVAPSFAAAEQSINSSVDSTQLLSAFAQAKVKPLQKPALKNKAKFELGRMLFFDKLLSGNKAISCATCHNPKTATTDGLALGFGERGRGETFDRRGPIESLSPRITPKVFNNGDSAHNTFFFDGRVKYFKDRHEFKTPVPGLNGRSPEFAEIVAALDDGLAAQALFPLVTPPEMTGFPGENEVASEKGEFRQWQAVTKRVLAIDEYQSLIKRAYPNTEFKQINIGHLASAIASFERHAFFAGETPFDRFLKGEPDSLSPRHLRGAEVFANKGQCLNCHNGPLLSDLKFHSIAVPQFGPGARAMGDDTGRGDFTGEKNDQYRFRTPPLRNVALGFRFMHNGAFASLEEAMNHHLDPSHSIESFDINQLPIAMYKINFEKYRNKNRDRIEAIPAYLKRGIALSDHEYSDLLAFLREGLTDLNSTELTHLIPSRVPSGLPVGD